LKTLTQPKAALCRLATASQINPTQETTIMKKLMLALAVAALLHVPTAKAVYIGTFTAGSFYLFEIVATGSVETAVTFMSIVRDDYRLMT